MSDKLKVQQEILVDEKTRAELIRWSNTMLGKIVEDHSPRCDCGHLFEICSHPNCCNGSEPISDSEDSHVEGRYEETRNEMNYGYGD